jgi:hypothetical protein
MPQVEEGAGGMKGACARATPFASGNLHTPPQSTVFHREYAQPVAAKIGRQQMASGSVEEQRMGMRRNL